MSKNLKPYKKIYIRNLMINSSSILGINLEGYFQPSKQHI